MEWNGKRILVWNMEDAQNGTEDLKNGMEDRLPYFHTNYIIIFKLKQITKQWCVPVRTYSIYGNNRQVCPYIANANNKITRCAHYPKQKS